MNEPIEHQDCSFWARVLQYYLKKAEYIYGGMVLKDIEIIEQKRSFKITYVNESNHSHIDIYKVEANLHVDIDSSISPSLSNGEQQQQNLRVSADKLAGLDYQVQRINQKLALYNITQRTNKFPAQFPSRRGGIILHGPAGTGKTLLLNAIAEAGWQRVLELQNVARGHHEGALKVRQIFAEARQNEPCAILIDQLENLTGRAGSEDTSLRIDIVSSLCAEFDQLQDTRILVIATTRNLSDINEDLRAHRRFHFEIETTVPDSRSRCQILKLLNGLSKDAESEALQRVGERTHGYVGKDLLSLFICAMDFAEERNSGSGSKNVEVDLDQDPISQAELIVTEADWNAAMAVIRPTAMREIFLETPHIRWTDIGGQQHVKKSLQKAIEWPLKV